MTGIFSSDEVHTAAFNLRIKMPHDERKGTQLAVKALAKEGYLTELSPLKRKNTPQGMKITLATYMKTTEYLKSGNNKKNS